MKKKLILFLGISFLFFSCASTNVEKVDDDIAETDNIENLQTDQNDENQEIQESQKENEQTQEELISEQYPELEDLTELEITDLEWQEEQENENNENNIEENQSEENTELIENEEELSPIEELQPIEEAENQTENQNQNEENIENQSENNDENLQESSEDDFSNDDEIIDLTENDSDDDIIEILEDSSDSTPEENVEPIIIVPSRKVTLNIGQTLEVLYPGSGWIYMGTTDNTKDFSFLGKKLGTENTKFTFKAKKQGNKILHFYKNDVLTQNYIDDYLEVEILSEKDSSNKTVQAPEYKQPVPKKVQTEITETETQNELSFKNENSQISQEEKSTQTNQTTNENSSSSSLSNEKNETNLDSTEENQSEENQNAEEIAEIDTTSLLEEAESLYNEKNYKDALSKLETYIEYSKDNRDKALYLQGQIYETDGEYKNVKKAIESYRTLTKNYPASSYWDSANKRIIYLTKFYLEGR